nr:hypothetical protein [Tanacetum cinerariifolium]
MPQSAWTEKCQIDNFLKERRGSKWLCEGSNVEGSSQKRKDRPRDIPLDSVEFLRYDKRSKSEIKGKVPTEMELVLEQTQQGTSHEVSISAEGVEELKRNVKIKGVKKEALHTLKVETESIHVLSETLSCSLRHVEIVTPSLAAENIILRNFGVVVLLSWLKGMKYVIHISKYPTKSHVEFKTCMLQGETLTWQNNPVQARGRAIVMALLWEDLKKQFKKPYLQEETRPTHERIMETNQGAVVLLSWLEGMEYVIHISKYPTKSQVEFKTCMLQGETLTWQNNPVQARGRAIAMALLWEDLKKLLIEEYYQDDAVQNLRKNSRIVLSLELMLIRMDWLSKLYTKIVCFEKIIQITLSNGEILEVHGGHPEGKLKQLKTVKLDELKLEDIPIIRNLPIVFREDLLGLFPSREVAFREHQRLTYAVHNVYEYRRSIGQIERHDRELKMSVPRPECSFRNIFFAYSQLMITISKNEPSFLLTNNTGAPQGEELGRIKPLSWSSLSWLDSSCISRERIEFLINKLGMRSFTPETLKQLEMKLKNSSGTYSYILV